MRVPRKRCGNTSSLLLLTLYQGHGGGGALPLIDKKEKPVIDRQGKCTVLEDVFLEADI